MKQQQGFSILEIMLAIVIGAIVTFGAYRMMNTTNNLAASTAAKYDAERQALILLQRVTRHYKSKKPGDIVSYGNASEKTLFSDLSCLQCNDTKAVQAKKVHKPYSFSLHHDTEGCRPPKGTVNRFPSKLLGCRALSVARGIWTENDNRFPNCGCVNEMQGEIYTVATKCQPIKAPTSHPLKQINLSSKALGLAQCSICKAGERPIVVENRYDITKSKTKDQWKVYPNGSGELIIGKALGNKVRSKRDTISKGIMRSAIGMEFCSSVDDGMITFDVNAFYLQKTTTEGAAQYLVKKVAKSTTLPKDSIINDSLRFIQ